ncbi:MAG: sialidase family protein, partial [Cyclobacteriaceae bacterium]
MKNIALLLMLLMLLSQAHYISGQSNLAELDAHSDIHAGENITIKSKFSTLPVVEPHIFAHPGNNNHLLVAAMVVTDVNNPYESCRLSSFVSTDGGKTWQETVHDWWGYDPWTAILPNGNTVMTWLGTEQKFKGQFPLQFFTSHDGGVSWSKNVQTISGAGHGHDGTKVTAYNNEFYYTTVRFNAQMGADVVLYRKEGNDEFKEVAVVDSKGARLNFCEPAILTDGTVIVPSSHFMEKLWVQQYNHKLGKLSDKTLVTIKPGGAGGYMRMIADVSATSKYKDRIYFARALGRNSDYQGVWINYSHDKGQTWSKDTRIDLFDNKLESRAIV